MRYAILSDIHGNLEALEAVVKATKADKVDAYISLGDIVGYGADPIAAIKIVQSLNPKASIAGNHDWGALGMVDIDDFSKFAQAAIEWTAGILRDEDREYLKNLELMHVEWGMTLVHGSLENPESFNYILDTGDVYITMELMKTPISFVGHSHATAVYREKSGNIERLDSAKVKIEKGCRYLVNVGSVGQPRDLDPRSSYVVYDDLAATIELRRAAYDIAAAQRKIIDAGLPAFLAYRLQDGQ